MTQQDAPSRLGFRGSIAALASAQKSAKGVSAYTVYVNRPAGRWLAAVGHVLGLTPNQVTLISAAFSFLAIGLLAAAPRSVGVGLAAGAALVLAFALDAADGQLARLRRAGSRAGEWLDHTTDCAVKLSLHAAVLVGWYRAGEADAVLLLPIAFQAAAVLLFFGGILTDKLRSRDPGSPPAPPNSRALVLLLPVDNGVVCASFLLWGFVDLFRGVYVVLLVAHVLFLVAFTVKWYRELS